MDIVGALEILQHDQVLRRDASSKLRQVEAGGPIAKSTEQPASILAELTSVTVELDNLCVVALGCLYRFGKLDAVGLEPGKLLSGLSGVIQHDGTSSGRLAENLPAVQAAIGLRLCFEPSECLDRPAGTDLAIEGSPGAGRVAVDASELSFRRPRGAIKAAQRLLEVRDAALVG